VKRTSLSTIRVEHSGQYPNDQNQRNDLPIHTRRMTVPMIYSQKSIQSLNNKVKSIDTPTEVSWASKTLNNQQTEKQVNIKMKKIRSYIKVTQMVRKNNFLP
jgi:hypothetical protein